MMYLPTMMTHGESTMILRNLMSTQASKILKHTQLNFDNLEIVVTNQPSFHQVSTKI